MPFVKEQDLLKLHEDLEHANRDNLVLLQRISEKDREVRKCKHQRMVMVGLSLSLLIVTLSIVAFTAGMVTQSRNIAKEAAAASQHSFNSSDHNRSNQKVETSVKRNGGDKRTVSN